MKIFKPNYAFSEKVNWTLPFELVNWYDGHDDHSSRWSLLLLRTRAPIPCIFVYSLFDVESSIFYDLFLSYRYTF
jgi:hypothetical protein